jgi:23S rRNA (adenine2503-C2)-methyltransferase
MQPLTPLPVTEKKPLLGLTLEELTLELGSRSRAIAAVKWLYAQPSESVLPAVLPGVSKRVWDKAPDQYTLTPLTPVERFDAEDGTRKFVFELHDGAQVESVLIPAKGRSTVCISSQAGCTRRCGFCATATLKFRRSLTAAEMVAQYRFARAHAKSDAPARNVVFMGMGEPMDNLDEVLRAVTLLTQSPAPQLGAEQVTVSTSGILPGMKRFLRESKASLALSLNASTDAQREALMPQNRTWPIASLMEALAEDAQRHPQRVHFIEYVMFDGINDTLEDADRVVAWMQGLNVRLNLIPHNPFPGNPLRPSPTPVIRAFQERVQSQGMLCFVRWPRGRDVAGACGQLALRKTTETIA